MARCSCSSSTSRDLQDGFSPAGAQWSFCRLDVSERDPDIALHASLDLPGPKCPACARPPVKPIEPVASSSAACDQNAETSSVRGRRRRCERPERLLEDACWSSRPATHRPQWAVQVPGRRGPTDRLAARPTLRGPQRGPFGREAASLGRLGTTGGVGLCRSCRLAGSGSAVAQGLSGTATATATSDVLPRSCSKPTAAAFKGRVPVHGGSRF